MLIPGRLRSEEWRVGKASRASRSWYHAKNKKRKVLPSSLKHKSKSRAKENVKPRVRFAKSALTGDSIKREIPDLFSKFKI